MNLILLETLKARLGIAPATIDDDTARLTSGPNAGRQLFYGSVVSAQTTPFRTDAVWWTDDDGGSWTRNFLNPAVTTNISGGEKIMRTFAGSNLLVIHRTTTARKQVSMSFDGGVTWTAKTNLTMPFGQPIQNGLAIVGTNIYLSFLGSPFGPVSDIGRRNLIIWSGTVHPTTGDLSWKNWQVVKRGIAGYSSLVPIVQGRRLSMMILDEEGTGAYWENIRTRMLTTPVPGP